VLDRLVLQHPDERGPPRIVHRLGQPGTTETGHRKVFHEHRLVLAHDLCGHLVVPVPTPVSDLGVLTCNLDTGLGPVLRPLLLAQQLPLKTFEFLLRPAQETRAADLRPIRQDRERGQPKVDTRLRLHLGKDVRLGVHDEAEEVPARTVPGDRQGRRRGREPAGPLDLEVADLGHVHRAVILKGEGVGVEADRLPGALLRLVPRRPDPAALPLSLEAVEEAPVGGIQVPKGLLQNDRRHLGKPGTFLGALGLRDTKPGQLRRRHICQPRRMRLLPVTQTVVPHHARTSERPRQRTALGGIRVGPVVVAKLHNQEPTIISLTVDQND